LQGMPKSKRGGKQSRSKHAPSRKQKYELHTGSLRIGGKEEKEDLYLTKVFWHRSVAVLEDWGALTKLLYRNLTRNSPSVEERGGSVQGGTAGPNPSGFGDREERRLKKSGLIMWQDEAKPVIT